MVSILISSLLYISQVRSLMSTILQNLASIKYFKLNRLNTFVYFLLHSAQCAQAKFEHQPYTLCTLFTRTISSHFRLPCSSDPIIDTELKFYTCNYVIALVKGVKFQYYSINRFLSYGSEKWLIVALTDLLSV